MVGDVEIHIYGKDWRAHGHGVDANFSRVRLHVVLFESRDMGPSDIPCLVLGPHLMDDIEGYLLSRHESGDIAHLFELWSGLQPHQIRRELLANAEKRWRQKLEFAESRIREYGFEEAMHGLTMEILATAETGCDGGCVCSVSDKCLEKEASTVAGGAHDGLHATLDRGGCVQPIFLRNASSNIASSGLGILGGSRV